MKKLVVELCMGSSCFARGNSQTLAVLESYLQKSGYASQVELVGHLCMGDCSKGPNIRIADATYQGLVAEEVLQLVVDALVEREGL
ncbi:(2Fe-2S) ferredoxin domain-containing protein [Sphaerochaeta halotolerans]|jgi:NADH:ubiquinone oxidoreductase subunit E|uniref:(2Fe-2S) ferredoxin domain-containing protein n=1 Tax=Sphaerochaeta halotolerans TaxID=2293840 RepID=A0A372MEJ7_9SPIR|nr:(2Fe-2S) ferredoxin domain-containing protein [Sphaerochaeta halotolerans]RFU94201.1 (2Fe-2S) ferredoxin domain-containing protein [Sphaerochaeta halotolerans]